MQKYTRNTMVATKKALQATKMRVCAKLDQNIKKNESNNYGQQSKNNPL